MTSFNFIKPLLSPPHFPQNRHLDSANLAELQLLPLYSSHLLTSPDLPALTCMSVSCNGSFRYICSGAPAKHWVGDTGPDTPVSLGTQLRKAIGRRILVLKCFEELILSANYTDL